MRPLQATAQTRLIHVDSEEVLPGLRFLPAPGHSIDHAVIELRSGGRSAIFGGDVMHHPVELYAPELVSTFCEFPEATRRSRLDVLERSAKDEVLYFSAHFPLSSVGRIAKVGNSFRWTFVDDEK